MTGISWFSAATQVMELFKLTKDHGQPILGVSIIDRKITLMMAEKSVVIDKDSEGWYIGDSVLRFATCKLAMEDYYGSQLDSDSDLSGSDG